MSRYIKHRRFKSWEWFEKDGMVKLFIFLLLSASRNDKKWQGIIIKRGELITSIASLKKGTKLTTRKIKTLLSYLERTGEINKRTNNRYVIITNCKYDSYKVTDNESNKPSNKRITNEQQTDNNKQECKELKEEDIRSTFRRGKG